MIQTQMNTTSYRHQQQRQSQRTAELLKDTGIDLVTPAQINLDLDVVEDGHTYAENATKKAVAFAQPVD